MSKKCIPTNWQPDHFRHEPFLPKEGEISSKESLVGEALVDVAPELHRYGEGGRVAVAEGTGTGRVVGGEVMFKQMIDRQVSLVCVCECAFKIYICMYYKYICIHTYTHNIYTHT